MKSNEQKIYVQIINPIEISGITENPVNISNCAANFDLNR